jgi:hypothetical protein
MAREAGVGRRESGGGSRESGGGCEKSLEIVRMEWNSRMREASMDEAREAILVMREIEGEEQMRMAYRMERMREEQEQDEGRERGQEQEEEQLSPEDVEDLPVGDQQNACPGGARRGVHPAGPRRQRLWGDCWRSWGKRGAGSRKWKREMGGEPKW